MDEATKTDQQLDGNGDQFQEGDGEPKTAIEAPPDGSPIQLVDDDDLRRAGADGPPLPRRLKIPENTAGHYVVLFALKPKRGERASYVEVACVKAHDPDHAKRVALENDGRSPKPFAERGEVARWLLERAGERGILLRAVPAMHWPQDVETTSFVRPEPILQIG